MKRIVVACFYVLGLISCAKYAGTLEKTSEVKYTGAMRNVMKKGELQATITLDTLTDSAHLFGIGPIEFLIGEITVFDGKSYVSFADSDSTMTVSETFDVKAPFFVFAYVEKWEQTQLPDTVIDLQSLEGFLNQMEKSNEKPFAFKMEAVVEEAHIHIMDLPQGTKVTSQEEVHQYKKNYVLKGNPVDLIGFYSTQHHAIFTHHDTNMHIHLITKDRKQMGHLESLIFKKGSLKLYIPKS